MEKLNSWKSGPILFPKLGLDIRTPKQNLILDMGTQKINQNLLKLETDKHTGYLSLAT